MDTNEPESASHKLLTTYELLENILSHLSTENLAQSQRVCRTWKDVIARSQLLRRHLFLEPDSRKDRISTNNVGSQHSDSPPFEPHPILSREGSRDDHYSKSNSRWYCELSLRVVERMCQWTDKHWTNMLMTQPPLKKVTVLAWAGRDLKSIYEEDFHDGKGVKMGVLVEATEKMTEFVDTPGAKDNFLFSVDIRVYY